MSYLYVFIVVFLTVILGILINLITGNNIIDFRKRRSIILLLCIITAISLMAIFQNNSTKPTDNLMQTNSDSVNSNRLKATAPNRKQEEVAKDVNKTNDTISQVPSSKNKDDIKTNSLKSIVKMPNNDLEKSSIKNETSNYINNTSIKNDIAILVIDSSNHQINSISSEIASLYRSKGHSVTTSLFTTDFLKSTYLTEVQSGSAKALDKLGLAANANYIVIAKYSNGFEPGVLTKWISRANLDVSIISCSSKSQIDGFIINPSNGYDDKQNAEKGAIEKIVLAYKTSHLNL